MVNKVRVYGKAQNRTALGIINAYLVINPEATLADLQQVFPDTLNPDSGVRINFVKLKEIKSAQSENWNGFFTAEDEILTLADGTKVAFVKMWTKTSFERLVKRAAGFAIEIAEFIEADKGGKKGGYRLEYLNGFEPAAPKKGNKWLIPTIICAAVIAAAAFFFLGRSGQAEPQVIIHQAKPQVIIHRDTVYVQQVEEIEKNFNAAQFKQGKSELNDQAKFALHDLAKLMKKNTELKVSIVGHTSAEGDAQKNQELSEARAKAAVDFLVSEGVDASRLKYEGKGSSEPVDPKKPELNRRTEFIVE